MAAAPALTVEEMAQRLVDDPINYDISGLRPLIQARVETRAEQIRRARDAANMVLNRIRVPRIHDNNDDDAGRRRRRKTRRTRKSRKSRKSRRPRKSRKSRKSTR